MEYETQRERLVSSRRRPQNSASASASVSEPYYSVFRSDPSSPNKLPQRDVSPHTPHRRGMALARCACLIFAGVLFPCLTIFTKHPLLEEFSSNLREIQEQEQASPEQPRVKPSTGPTEEGFERLVSNFDWKPHVVGYIDTHNGSPRKYHTVIRIHPETFEIIPNAESTQLKNQTKALWTRFPSEAAPTTEGDDSLTKKKKKKKRNSTSTSMDEDEHCQLSREWMENWLPTCNNLHEQSMIEQLLDPHRQIDNFLMGQGQYRSAWALEQKNVDHNPRLEVLVLKTLHLWQSYDRDTIDRNRRDALVSERLTGSSHFLNVYDYCGGSSIYEFAGGGSLYDAIGAREQHREANDPIAHAKWEKWSNQHKFDIAYQVVNTVADLHDMDHDGRPSVAHGDLDITQFVSTDGGTTYKLSDFNGSPFIKWHNQTNESCPHRPMMSGGKTRSPEEYLDELVTEAVDVYSMGNILYTIVVGEYPYRKLLPSRVQARAIKGFTPLIPDEIKTDSDPTIQTLLNAMRLCWGRDPKTRASAGKVKEYLQSFAENVTITL